MSNVTINQSAKVTNGIYAGLVGNVEKIDEHGRVFLSIHGVTDGQCVDYEGWFVADQVEAL